MLGFKEHFVFGDPAVCAGVECDGLLYINHDPRLFVGKFHSIGEAAIQAGNSESIIRRHDLDMKSQEEAERFVGIK